VLHRRRHGGIDALVKLYPWEWMTREEFGLNLRTTDIRLIEPPWKMLLSNKGLLPILWELNPGHPNLLPAAFDRWRLVKEGVGDYVQKPLYSREGANVTIFPRRRVHPRRRQLRRRRLHLPGLHADPEVWRFVHDDRLLDRRATSPRE
jgi:glutathionylspermidine synthase